MGDVGVFLLIMAVVSTVSCLVLGWINYKIGKLKEDNKLNIDTIGSIIALEKAMKKLNEALRIHEHRLDHQRDDIYGIQRRLDILEANHPDSDIDYATLDDHDEVVEVWFNGKKYVPEDKLDEDTVVFYADDRIVAETTRPDVKCCATCKHYRPGPDHTCTIRPWLHVTSIDATNIHSACNNYEKTESGFYSATKGQVDYPYIAYEYMSGNCRADKIAKRLDELRRSWEEWMQNDS